MKSRICFLFIFVLSIVQAWAGGDDENYVHFIDGNVQLLMDESGNQDFVEFAQLNFHPTREYTYTASDGATMTGYWSLYNIFLIMEDQDGKTIYLLGEEYINENIISMEPIYWRDVNGVKADLSKVMKFYLKNENPNYDLLFPEEGSSIK